MSGPYAGQLGAGLGGSVFVNGYPGAAVGAGAASTVPEGPATITQAGFGTAAAASPGPGKGLTAAAIGTAALIALAFIWWSLPR